eukprot:gene24520-10124_t
MLLEMDGEEPVVLPDLQHSSMPGQRASEGFWSVVDPPARPSAVEGQPGAEAEANFWSNDPPAVSSAHEEHAGEAAADGFWSVDPPAAAPGHPGPSGEAAADGFWSVDPPVPPRALGPQRWPAADWLLSAVETHCCSGSGHRRGRQADGF